jgi:predicted transglutaminase-like cysteine proteinase
MGGSRVKSFFRAGVAVAVIYSAIAMSAAPASAASRAPLGFQLMCLQNPAECRGGGRAIITGTPTELALLKRVNTMVNRAMRPRNDTGIDLWTVGGSAGDCEDYAVTKRHHLIRGGIPASSLRIAYVKTRWGEGHAVLVVNTSRGDLVLDNLTPAIRLLSQTGYRLISISGSNPERWS